MEYARTSLKKIFSYHIARFIVSGGTAAVSLLAILFVLTEFVGVWYIASSILAFIVSVFINFTLQRLWVFENDSQKNMTRQAILFFGVNLMNLLINAVLMYLFVDIAHFWYMLAQVCTSIIIAFESFIVYKKIIFHERAPAQL